MSSNGVAADKASKAKPKIPSGLPPVDHGYAWVIVAGTVRTSLQSALSFKSTRTSVMSTPLQDNGASKHLLVLLPWTRTERLLALKWIATERIELFIVRIPGSLFRELNWNNKSIVNQRAHHFKSIRYNSSKIDIST